MIFIQLIAFALCVLGIVWALGLTPEQINKDLSPLLERRESLEDMSKMARGKKKQNKLLLELSRIRRILTETGKEKSFSVALTVSLILMVIGCIAAILMDNIFLAPVLAILFAMMPFMYLMRSVNSYNKHVSEDLEMSLSLITTAYIDCDNLKMAVTQYADDLRPSMNGIFKEFLGEVETISPNTEEAIYHMKNKVDNAIFREWCDQLIACQSDGGLKDTLPAIVSKLRDERLVNSELRTMLSEVRREYYFMVAFVVANIPILYCINKDWYNALMHTVFGKLVLGITGIVILITWLRVNKQTRPIEYGD